MTLLVASVFARTVAEAKEKSESAWTLGADAVELRIDEFVDAPEALARFLVTQARRTWIIACRGVSEDGRSTRPVGERAESAARVAKESGAIVDFELADWRDCPEARRAIESAVGTEAAFPRLILSYHGSVDDLPALEKRIEEASSATPHCVAKTACEVRHINESFAALDAMRVHGGRCAAIATGDEGAWTRVLAKKLGAFASYASLPSDEPTAPGQWTVAELRDRFRWDSIDAETRVFGVIGDPVAHSLGPALFNRWFAEHGVNAVYLPLHVRGGQRKLAGFLDECSRRPWLDVGGLSVTIPHKVAALKWVGESADPMSRSIGAANTLRLGPGGPSAYNTDCYAAIGSLCDSLGCDRADLAGVTVDVLGAGGAASAVLHGLHEFGCRTTVYARSVESARPLETRFGCSVRPWSERARRAGEIVINGTPIGMTPEAATSPLPPDAFAGCRLAFDLVYRPNSTRFLLDAARAGCRTLGGLDMFARQAATQFELWTGTRPDADTAISFLEREIRAKDNAPSDSVRRKPCIALIGARGSGKTVVGRALARLLGDRHVDTDDLVVASAGRSIADIFAAEGEVGFRRREAEAIQAAVAHPPAVLSLGGGAMLDQRNVDAIRSIAFVVWLTAPPDILRRRIASDAAEARSRPDLTSEGTLAEIERVLAAREPLYRRAADLTIETSERNPDEIAREILRNVVGPAV